MLDLHQLNGACLRYKESKYVEAIKDGSSLIPEGLHMLLSGLGNTKSSGGDELLFMSENGSVHDACLKRHGKCT